MKIQKIALTLVVVPSLISYSMAHGYRYNKGRHFGNFQGDYGNYYTYNGGFANGHMHAAAYPEMHPFPYDGMGGDWIGQDGGVAGIHASPFPDMHPLLNGDVSGYHDVHPFVNGGMIGGSFGYPGEHPFFNGGMVGGSFGYPSGYGEGFHSRLFFGNPTGYLFRPAIRPAMFTRFPVSFYDYGRPMFY